MRELFGWLERFLVLTALLLQSPATVELILTAKSIVQYPQLKSVRFAEYFLIGTLLSSSMGILGGLILLKPFEGRSRWCLRPRTPKNARTGLLRFGVDSLHGVRDNTEISPVRIFRLKLGRQ